MAKKKEGAAAMLELPGVTAAYWPDGDRFHLFGSNAITGGAQRSVQRVPMVFW